MAMFSKQKNSVLKRTCSFWIEFDKNTYKGTMQLLRSLSDDNVKYKILDNSGVMKITFPMNYLTSVQNFFEEAKSNTSLSVPKTKDL